MTGNGQSLCEKISDVDGIRDEDNAELVLLHAIPQPVKSHIKRFRHLQIDAVVGEADCVIATSLSQNIGVGG